MTLTGRMYAQMFHAHCSIDVTVYGMNCMDVNISIINQVNDRTGFDSNCKYSDLAKEFCGYSMHDITDSKIHLKHETPVKHYVDDIYFTYKQMDNYCLVSGSSQSEPISYYDYDTNYCNMFNLFRNGNATQLNYNVSIQTKKCKFHPDIGQDLSPSIKQCNKY